MEIFLSTPLETMRSGGGGSGYLDGFMAIIIAKHFYPHSHTSPTPSHWLRVVRDSIFEGGIYMNSSSLSGDVIVVCTSTHPPA